MFSESGATAAWPLVCLGTVVCDWLRRGGEGGSAFPIERGRDVFATPSPLLIPTCTALTPSFHRPARCAEVQAQGLIEAPRVRDGIECTCFLHPDGREVLLAVGWVS